MNDLLRQITRLLTSELGPIVLFVIISIIFQVLKPRAGQGRRAPGPGRPPPPLPPADPTVLGPDEEAALEWVLGRRSPGTERPPEPAAPPPRRPAPRPLPSPTAVAAAPRPADPRHNPALTGQPAPEKRRRTSAAHHVPSLRRAVICAVILGRPRCDEL